MDDADPGLEGCAESVYYSIRRQSACLTCSKAIYTKYFTPSPAVLPITANWSVPLAEAKADHPSPLLRQLYPQTASSLLEGTFATFQYVANRFSNFRILQSSGPIRDRR